ncbi:bifunctional [glutamine synthetase] adenylyltransferase/[glutamine synthetase]-adenylyl-L-tyrosine phosphorylase [Tessaracoccus caeni]|uniref:bifunctional [glutamine synthetase] adenylyltransferase/[glutamine synthetase]-adenylyl-L-tyrosine phosphorylase n=1 Tax=Tessaracoccus caeni TaxID=3031239 RepID=UPI0023DA6BEA|nr:bifunctional [glutamine synthetase] adenylyltransferase/[glutamine synthetase]-adenylyl-L-tyrosine phosphorylase [Tessaracoccus caeni]MDF1486908.1 bifunctional [glutamine synthetase] adenylyltransferase/[glutamine synthetase]-adenylyl-L-tyrosine phosphorylase [Tessaracoccus caeni]
MTRISSPTGEFARRGFQSPSTAARTWERWGTWLGHTPDVDLALFEHAADRDQALDALERIAQNAPTEYAELAADRAWLTRVIRVLGASSGLTQTLTRHPELVWLLQQPPGPRDREGWQRFFAGFVEVDDDGVARGDSNQLRIANRAALIEIAARDLEAADPYAVVDQLSQELAFVAEMVLELSLAFARAEVAGWEKARLAVLSMGKTGARELNYLSDVDVIYVCEPAEGVDPTAAQEVGARLAAAQARICSAFTPEGSIFAVDAALRPEGKAGSLVRTLSSYLAYYKKWAKNWEFQALLKARPVAGDLALGHQFVEAVAPMVWAVGEHAGFLSEVRAMRERVVSLIPAKEAKREIKLGAGGLRDTEFSVQLLQLTHGRADERLRLRGTFEALRALVDCGYIGRADGAEMEQAYRFQRVLEHRVQLRRLRRTHLLPDDVVGLRDVGRTMGIAPEDLQKKWRSSALLVERLQRRIFFSPLLDAVSSVPTDSLRLSPEAAKDRMRALGFEDPRAALGHIEALTRGTSRAVEIQRQLMPAMLGWFAQGTNPDYGLLSFRQLSEALGSTSWYLRALRDEGFMAQRLAQICSSSRFVVNLLRRAPENVRLLSGSDGLRVRTVEELTTSMTSAAQRKSEVEQAIESIRALRRSELCRIALSDVLGDVDIDTVGVALSDLTSASIDAALDVARREVDAPEVGVIALGRWGGSELSYSSDADCMFVVPDGTDADGRTAATELVRRASQLLGRPGPDLGVEIDTDLRPEGKGGPQVRTVSSYANYYEKWAATWEYQMLLRARPGAGAQDLAAQVLSQADRYRYPAGGLEKERVIEIRRLKSRMEKERIPRNVDPNRHLKLGPGGLSDIEWSVQLLQLKHGHEFPGLRATSTLAALAAAVEAGLVTSEEAEVFAGAWRHVSRLRNAIMLVRGRASDVLPSNHQDLASIGQLMGYDAYHASNLLDDTMRHTRRAAAVVDRVFWED